jgi:AcrR family transcriptional regulator
MKAPPPGSRLESLRQAALDLIAERGSYDAVPLEELLSRAGVDRAWFDRHFADRDQCLLWANTLEIRRFMDRLWAVYERESSWRDGLRAAAYEMADVIGVDPRFPYVGVGYGGDSAQLERDIVARRMVDMVDLGRQEMDDPAAANRSVAEATVGSIMNALRVVVASDEAVDAAAFVPQFMFIAVRPYLGDEAAREELATPRPA